MNIRKSDQSIILPLLAWGIAVLVPSVVPVVSHGTTIAYAAPEGQTPRQEEVVLIEAKIDWTQERIIEEIETVFPDAPIMVEVARCESGLRPVIEGPTDDHGVFQIHMPSHGESVRALGLDVKNDPRDNIRFARMLYDRNGLRDWSASAHCWDK